MFFAEALIGLDFETYGSVDLRTHGLNRYMEDPYFTPLIAHTYGHMSGLTQSFDFVLKDRDSERDNLRDLLRDKCIVAHNAPFEKLCLKMLGIDIRPDRIVDSAVVARAVGASSKLEVAAPQLLNVNKLATGKHLIKLFSIPGKLQEANGSPAFDPDIVQLYPDEWVDFGEYCGVDAKLGLGIVVNYHGQVSQQERRYAELTMKMNERGWFVDMAAVERMQELYEKNKNVQLNWFRTTYEEGDVPDEYLNFNSFPQLQRWCANRGVKAKSFDEAHVEKMIATIDARLAKGGLPAEKLDNLYEVRDLLVTKQVLGGSSLKKLVTITNQRSLHDDRLRDQYLHVGAGQTYRTSGRGVQMQNLKRLADQQNMGDLWDPAHRWDNQMLATNLRQVFKAQHPDGRLVVGDFASVESRGLAYLAGEEWKLDAYWDGLDLYKVQAEKMFNVPYDSVDKQQRQTGKVGELSCGYGAGSGAVQNFAAGMGVKLTEQEATALVRDWRDANPNILQLWDKLDSTLRQLLERKAGLSTVMIGNDLKVAFEAINTPASLEDQVGVAKVQSVAMRLYDSDGGLFLTRYLHGCYLRGSNIGYFKPTDLLSGDLWKNHYRDPKTKEIRFYTVYGGKLAGLLTQSLCRELFFNSLQLLDTALAQVSNARCIGQFHDEIVVEWQPESFEDADLWLVPVGLDRTKRMMEEAMSTTQFANFPLMAEVKDDHRYTK